MKTKTFTLNKILSVATGRLVCDMDGVYEILNFMTGDNLFTHQLPRAFRECKPHLLRQHPALKKIEKAPGLDAALKGAKDDQLMKRCGDWVAALAKKYGTELSVQQIPKDDHEVKDPISEMIEMRGGKTDGIIVVRPEDQP